MMGATKTWILWEHCFSYNKTKRIIDRSVINLKNCLVNGQAFAWHKIEDEESKADKEMYHGVLHGAYYAFKYDDQDRVNYWVYPETTNAAEILSDYFQLDHDYDALMKSWCEVDPHFAKMGPKFKGLRLLRQEPFECLICFICSQNNNIPRITQLVESIRSRYGKFVIESYGKKFYTFPTLDELSKATEDELRDMKFGYRANYIVESVKAIKEKGGESWLKGLRGKSSAEVQKELCQLKGIGKKVADCISLFSMDCKNAIPVDTHIFQIYAKHYSKGKETKMSAKSYDQVSGYFQERFGEYAGWAHTFLFTADLQSFKKEVEAEVEELVEKVADNKEVKKPKKIPAKRKDTGSRSKSTGKKVRK